MKFSSKFYSNIKLWCLEDIENRGAVVILEERSNVEQDEEQNSVASCVIGDEVLISSALKELMNRLDEKNAVGRCMRAAVMWLVNKIVKEKNNEQHNN